MPLRIECECHSINREAPLKNRVQSRTGGFLVRHTDIFSFVWSVGRILYSISYLFTFNFYFSIDRNNVLWTYCLTSYWSISGMLSKSSAQNWYIFKKSLFLGTKLDEFIKDIPKIKIVRLRFFNTSKHRFFTPHVPKTF